jgi:hypothetical protein
MLDTLHGDEHMGGSPAPLAAPDGRAWSLDSLAGLGTEELLDLYRRARTPSVADVEGDLRGRMLAVRGAGPFWAVRLRAFARWKRFPWRGKSFRSLDGGRGEGINRVFGDTRPRRWFRFETFVGRSRAGAFDAVQLDYDNPDNPFFIRAIKDEVREVSPGVFLGQAYLVTRRRTRLVLYFGLARP